MNQQFENGIDQKSVPGCLGRMVDLFDLSAGNKLLTNQLHGDGSPLSRNQSHGGRISRFSNLIEHKVMSSDPTHSSLLNGTPMKMLIANEMSKEIYESPQGSPGLVFKLMGVDTGPQELLGRGSQRGRQRGHSRSLSGSSLSTTAWQQEQKESKEIYEIWMQPQKGSSGRDKTMLTMSQPGEIVTEKKMAIVRQKFIEAKQLATDEKLRQSKQFEDALDVLSSNKDLFIRFLQEPNSLLAQHLRDLHLQSLPPSTTEPRRITVLRPSKMVDSNNIALLTKKSENSTKMTAFTSKVLGCKTDDNQPTRIILLRPSSGQIGEQNPPKSDHGQQIDENFSGVSRVETSLSSAVSNGYIADESSFCKSDNEYQNGKLSDSEIVSPTSRHSWDFINKFDIHSCSSFSRASYLPGSLVCKEAKKRLSERWAMTSTVTSDVQKLVQRNSSCTLGEILAISDIKNPAESHEQGFSKELEPRASTLSNDRESNEDENVVNSQRNLFKSKSVPVSSTVFGERLDSEVSKSGVGEKDGFKDDTETKILTRKLSFKEKVSSLFFSINKKTDKENPRSVQSPGKIGGENSSQHDHQAIKNQENLSNNLQGSDSISLGLNCDASSSEKPVQPRSTSCNQEQPSPISVLEAPFVDHETANLDSSEGKGAKPAVPQNKCRLVDKSPPIGSVSRVLSWESSCGETRASHELENTFHRSSEEEEEAEWFFLVQTLLYLAGLDNVEQLSSVFERFDSSESPLDLSLRDKYVDLNDKELLMHETSWRKRSSRKLVFDCVNAALVEISCMTQMDSSESLMDLVWAWIKKWRSSEVVGCASTEEDDEILVDLMVRKEVAGNGFVESFVPLEIELLVKEMEAHLMEEIVGEAVVE